MHRLGVVSFLNSRPLIHGLDARNDVNLLFDVPSALPERLERGEVDAALIPVIDVLRSEGRYRVISDACIGCDGETMTVRVFSQIPPDRIRTLFVDGDSHTSIALATVLWRELHEVELDLNPLDAGTQTIDELDAVLLIGDKVIDRHRRGFAYEVDLGAAWRQHTGLPFVFAVWACRSDQTDLEQNDALATLLSEARDRGLAAASQIAETEGPKRWWPVDLARRYLMHCLNFRLSEASIRGADHFAQLCIEAGIVPGQAGIRWPQDAAPTTEHAQ